MERLKSRVIGEIQAIYPRAFVVDSGMCRQGRQQASLALTASMSVPAPRAFRAVSSWDDYCADDSLNDSAIKSVLDLLALHNPTFVRYCYRVLLKREPDPAGFRNNLEALRRKELDKLDIIRRLVNSPEGKRAHVKLRGMRLARIGAALRRLPFVGTCVQCILSLLELPQLQRRISDLEECVSEHAAKASSQSPAAAEEAADENPKDFDRFYLEFENHFRGSREVIKARHEVYLPVVEQLVNELGAKPVLDIACGRGEWLELLREHNYPAEGVDINAESLAEFDDRKLVVHQIEGLEFLKGIDDCTYLAVTALHLIEHLPLNSMLRLIDEILRVLVPGGKIILETPNPSNLIVGAHTFYLDPTHRNPLPPAMMQFVVQQRGFKDATILALHPPQETCVIRGIEGADVLNDLLFGCQDYAVIGTKK